jgi:hypothetical protein
LKRLVLLPAAALLATAAFFVSAASSSADSSGLPTLTLSLSGSSISVGGTAQSGAVNITATSTAKDAEPTLVHLNPGVTADQLLAAAPHIPDPNAIAPYGQIIFDGDAPKGTTNYQTVLPAGDYVALDTSANNPSKWPHTAFTVAQSASPAALPAASAKVRAIEFGFKTPRTLHNGKVVRFQNDGFLVHMVIGIRAKNAKGARTITRLLKAGKDSKTQKIATGFNMFMGPTSHGGVVQETVKVRPGIWVLACFMSTQDNREHTQLGMLHTIRIK